MPFSLPLLEWCPIPKGQGIQPFSIAKYPITNEQFAAFIQDGGYQNPIYWDGLAQSVSAPRASDYREADNPKLQVCWYEAMAYSRWLSEKMGFLVRLPSEREWEWAAVGSSGWVYPYGVEFDIAKTNTREAAFGRSNLVRDFTFVQTVFGTVDMAGNVYEWCLDEAESQSLDTTTRVNRVLKGGSWNNPQAASQVSASISRTPMSRTFNIGFRVMMQSF